MSFRNKNKWINQAIKGMGETQVYISKWKKPIWKAYSTAWFQSTTGHCGGKKSIVNEKDVVVRSVVVRGVKGKEG